jgi:hypothetical protein
MPGATAISSMSFMMAFGSIFHPTLLGCVAVTRQLRPERETNSAAKWRRQSEQVSAPLVPLSLLSNQIGGCIRPFGISTIDAIIL